MGQGLEKMKCLAVVYGVCEFVLQNLKYISLLHSLMYWDVGLNVIRFINASKLKLL